MTGHLRDIITSIEVLARQRDEAQVQLAELREAARALLGAGDDPDPDCDCEVCVALRRLRALAGEGELSR